MVMSYNVVQWDIVLSVRPDSLAFGTECYIIGIICFSLFNVLLASDPV